MSQRQEALDMFHSNDLIGLGAEARAVRHRIHPECLITYDFIEAIDCALSIDEICESIDRLTCAPWPFLRLQVSQDCPSHISFYEDLLCRTAKEGRPGDVSFAFFDISLIADLCKLSISRTLATLRDAGLVFVLDEPGRVVSARDRKPSFSDSLNLHRLAHSLGLQTTFVIEYRTDQDIEQRLDVLAAIGQLQADTNGFLAFEVRMREATSVENLTMLALSRCYLDGIPNLEASAPLRDAKARQLEISFGANDFGNIPWATGSRRLPDQISEEQICCLIRDAGFTPRRRASIYRTVCI